VTSTQLLLVRHGETDWARDRRHTGRTDIPLNDTGRAQATQLAHHLPLTDVVAVWSSPLQRAQETARLAGLTVDRVDDDLMEWDYGSAEGRTTDEIRAEQPGWDVWDHGVVGLGGAGETLAQVATRVDRVIARARELDGKVVLVAHAHLLRVLGARWIDESAHLGRHLLLDPAGWAELGWERESPAIHRWNPPPLITTDHLR